MLQGVELAESQIPYYLTQEQKEGFKKALSDFNSATGPRYYSTKEFDYLLQGDGISGLPTCSLNGPGINKIRGIVLSNTCDISQDNPRILPAKLIFAPIIKLSKLEQLLLDNSVSQQSLTDISRSIREQEMSSIFYLPPIPNEKEEYVALLDDLHTVSVKNIDDDECVKLFTLDLFGFYFFVFKLSFHFCRLHEEVDRGI